MRSSGFFTAATVVGDLLESILHIFSCWSSKYKLLQPCDKLGACPHIFTVWRAVFQDCVDGTGAASISNCGAAPAGAYFVNECGLGWRVICDCKRALVVLGGLGR